MSIEFSCPHCDHLLRTADEKAGLSARCPACGETIWVPHAHAASARPETPPGDALPIPVSGDAGVVTDNVQHVAAAPPPERDCPACGASNPAEAPACGSCGTAFPQIRRPKTDDWTPRAFDIGEVMSTAWRIYTSEIGLLLGATLVSSLLVMLLCAVIGLPIVIGSIALDDNWPFVAVPGTLVGLPLILLVTAVFQLGMTRLMLNAARGRGPGIGDLFYGFGEGRRFIFRGVLLLLVACGLMLVGMLLCCAPGLIVMLTWWPAFLLLLDRDPPGGSGISLTYEFVTKNFGQVLAVGAIAAGVLIVAGMVPYLNTILQLFASPFATLFTTVGYLRLIEDRTACD